MKARIIAICVALGGTQAWAKLPPPPPPDPVKVEEAKAKEAEAKVKAAELQAKYEDRAVANHAAKAKAEGREFKPALGAGVQPPPLFPAPAPAAATVAATPAMAGASPPGKK
jgi:hypothetical protein